MKYPYNNHISNYNGDINCNESCIKLNPTNRYPTQHRTRCTSYPFLSTQIMRLV